MMMTMSLRTSTRISGKPLGRQPRRGVAAGLRAGHSALTSRRRKLRSMGRALLCALFIALPASTARAHEAHMLIGHSADGQLKWHPTAGVPGGEVIVLDLIPKGGPIEGYSAAIPGFSMVLTADPANDIFPLNNGANVWLELVLIDTPLLLIETPTYWIVNFLDPPVMRIGAGSTTHNHPLWLLDTIDPAYDPTQCIWEATFVLVDRGSTSYAASEPITFRFVAGRIPSPADLDCDGDVDVDDLAIFTACATGPAIPYDLEALPEGCLTPADHQGILRPDLDRDGDIDQSDFGLFQRCYTGADPTVSGQDHSRSCLDAPAGWPASGSP